jgi:hypothetical protein
LVTGDLDTCVETLLARGVRLVEPVNTGSQRYVQTSADAGPVSFEIVEQPGHSHL